MIDRPRIDVLVIGAGPAGLTAAHTLMQRGRRVTVLEKDAQVGGLARTVTYKGFRFDIGGHRFFTKVDALRNMWHAMLGPESADQAQALAHLLQRSLLLDYPLQAAQRASWSRHRQRRPRPRQLSVESSATDCAGRRASRTGSPTASAGACIEIFFKTYTEKVWGMPCSAIGAQWAAQRIKGAVALDSGLRHAVQALQTPGRARPIKSLIEEFEYPRLGPGMMWEAFERRLVARRPGRAARSLALRPGP